MTPHSSTLAWKIPWTEGPGGLQSMGSLRVGQDWATSLSLFTFMHWRRKWQPLQCSCLENPRNGAAWWAAIYGVTQSRTGLKRLIISSSSNTTYTSTFTSWNINLCLILFWERFIMCKWLLSAELWYLRICERFSSDHSNTRFCGYPHFTDNCSARPAEAMPNPYIILVP